MFVNSFSVLEKKKINVMECNLFLCAKKSTQHISHQGRSAIKGSGTIYIVHILKWTTFMKLH